VVGTTAENEAAMHLIKPSGSKKKWDIRIKIHDGRTLKFAGDRDRQQAKRIGMKIECLVRAKTNGEGAPVELAAWIDNMPESLATRLTAVGLLDRRRIEQVRPIQDHIDQFKTELSQRGKSTIKYIKSRQLMVRRICDEIGAKFFTDLTVQRVQQAIYDLKSSEKTRSHYIDAIKDFCKWMVRAERTTSDPLVNLRRLRVLVPSYERRPLTVEEFRKLLAYLDKTPRYPHQRFHWTAYDRKLLYWTAVKTGFEFDIYEPILLLSALRYLRLLRSLKVRGP
jgi:hypothetical protein